MENRLDPQGLPQSFYPFYESRATPSRALFSLIRLVTWQDRSAVFEALLVLPSLLEGRYMIIDHTHPAWLQKQAGLGKHKYNGAYYYSQEIVQNIIPYIKTDRPWVTVNVQGECMDNAIVFIHSNINTERTYRWLKQYNNLVLICGVRETVEKVSDLGKAFYLPLSIDTEYVKQFRTKQDRLIAFAGRVTKDKNIPEGVPKIQGVPREELLKEMAHYRYIYAVGRTALEAKCLGATILPYDPRFLDVELWEVLDNKDVIPRLQTMLDAIDE